MDLPKCSVCRVELQTIAPRIAEVGNINHVVCMTCHLWRSRLSENDKKFLTSLRIGY